MSDYSLLAEVISMLLAEEFIGNKGGVNYYQMGGSIKRPELYNLDSKGKATRDPGLPGMKKTRRSRKAKR